MYVDDEAFYRLIFACCLFCCIMSHTLNGHNFFPSMQQQWVCVALLALLTVTVTLADGGKPEKQGNRTFYFLRHSYCSVLSHIAIFYPTLLCIITTDLSVLPCATLFTPYATIYYPISPHCSILPLSALYYPTLYTYNITTHASIFP